MKKSLSIVLVLLLLLTACQVMPDDDQSLASTPSSSGCITPPPSSSVVPPSSSTAPTVPTTQPTVPPTTQPVTPPSPAKDGSAVIFRGPPFYANYPEWYPREGLVDHLYWAVKSTGESILVCDEPVIDATKTDTNIFFVKKSEPTKVYVTAIGDFKNHEFVCESTYGSVSAIRNYTNSSTLLQFVADGKKFVVYDMATGESTVLMEQYHINFAVLYCNDDGTWGDWIEFEGQHTEDDGPYTLYLYNWKTGELWEDTAL
ncbi:MAG: hypothetical protein E7447_06185 [Ruminococcaceae bacterium]|nr:hypothetical protein [Oscillospiraceae bacterium]